MMREALAELYGTGGPLLEQYFTYWRRMLCSTSGPRSRPSRRRSRY